MAPICSYLLQVYETPGPLLCSYAHMWPCRLPRLRGFQIATPILILLACSGLRGQQRETGGGNCGVEAADRRPCFGPGRGVRRAPDLTLTKSHSGNFAQGQTGAAYNITVRNRGNAVTTGTVTVIDTLPAGLTATAIAGVGWACMLSTLTCTRVDALVTAATYPAILVTVNVASNAPMTVTNTATVSGGGETNTSNDTVSDVTTISATATVGPPVTDNFNSPTLNTSLWTFVNPVGDGSYSMTGTQLRLNVPAGNNHDPVFGGADNAVRVVQPIANGDFVVTMKFDSIPTQEYQFEGIVVDQDAANHLRFQFGSDGNVLGVTASEIVSQNETSVASNVLTLPNGVTSLWLQVQRSGNNWTESWSPDGATFNTAGTFTQVLTANDIGLFAGNYNDTAGAAPAFSVLVDSFVSGAASGGGPPGAPDLTIAKSHTGNFSAGQTGAAYTITVTNSGTVATSGTVGLTDTLPAGLTATAMAGTGWTCTSTSLTCLRGDSLAAAASYPAVTLIVNLASNVPATLTNTVTVFGGNETNTSNDTATDIAVVSGVVSSGLAIGQVNVLPQTTSAAVTWTTNAPASSRVDYGTTAAYGGYVSDPTLVTSHSLNISNLTCGTTYDFQITSGNPSGNATTLNATFATSACGTTGGPASDNFDATTLNSSLWTFINPAGDGSFALNGSSLTLLVPQGAQHDAGPSGDGTVRVMQSVSNADFQVEVRFQSSVMYAYQRQGVIVEQDSSHYLRFDVTNDGTTSRLTATSFIAGANGALVDMPISGSGPPFWLRISRAGNSWTESYSLDGTNYTAATAFSFVLTVDSIGPFVGNSGTALPAMAAEVDYFFNTASKPSNLDGPLTFVRAVIDPNPPPTTLEKVLADIDGDGRLDAVMGFGNSPGSTLNAGIAWYQYPHSGNPMDVWQKYTILATGDMYEDAKALDVNGDGAVDIIASFSDGTISWFENPRGRGGNPASDPWVQHSIGTGSGENNMAIADIDGDGKLDLVTNGFVFFQNTANSWTAVPLPRSSNGVASAGYRLRARSR